MALDSSAINVENAWKPERTLVLLGKTGNGKSATGNSILGKTMFQSKARGKFITKECKLHKSELPNGLTINVIDTPGLFSASSTTDFTIKEIVRCLLLAKGGIDAVLLVFSLRNRLTEEEQSTLRTLKILFGSQIVNYIIVVFTNEDALEDGETLDDYLEDCPEFEEILKECDDRKVMFDNRRNAPASKKDKQVQDLLNLVEQISKKNNGKSYMGDLFLELKENEATIEEKQKQIEAMKGWSSNREISQMKKLELEKSRKEMLEGVKEKVETRLRETRERLEQQLNQEQVARIEMETRAKEVEKQSSDVVKKLNEEQAARLEMEKSAKESEKHSTDEVNKLLKETIERLEQKLNQEQAARLEMEKRAKEAEKQSSDVVKKLNEEQAARLEMETSAKEAEKHSADEVKKLREDLARAEKMTKELQEKAKQCIIL